jgi:hypothetical protein
MTTSKSSTSTIFVVVSIVAVVIIGVVFARNLTNVEHLAKGVESQSFTIDMDFDRFRQIMVRKNGTASIIGHAGMKLLDEKIEDVELDTSGDDRPILNAIRGKSKSELSAVKLLTVQIDDPTVKADKLELRQIADIEPKEIHVVTKSTGPAGQLEQYMTTLYAQPNGKSTDLTVNVNLSVRVNVPRLFQARAEARVQQAAEKAVANQTEAMKKFFAEHADEQIILPKLGSK